MSIRRETCSRCRMKKPRKGSWPGGTGKQAFVCEQCTALDDIKAGAEKLPDSIREQIVGAIETYERSEASQLQAAG